jgi:hypothetical protein
MRVFWASRRLSFLVLMRGGIFAVLGTCGAFGASPPGSLISVTAMSGAPEGASAYRILYTSTGLSGEPTPTPRSSWAHATYIGVRKTQMNPPLMTTFMESVV